jgi:hypothetical protein
MIRFSLVIIGVLFVFNGLFAQGPISYEKLKGIFPTELENCKVDPNIDGALFSFDDIAFSNAAAVYSGNNLEIQITVMDCYGAKDMFTSSEELVDKRMSFETDDSFGKTIKLDNKLGYIVGDKGANSTNLILIWDQRFIVNISVVGKVDEDIVLSIYEKLNLTILN